MFKSKLFRFIYAISVAEGWLPRNSPDYPDGTASYINHNPGNLRSSIFEVGKSGNDFSIFENDFVGYFACAHQIYLYASGKSAHVNPNQSIAEAMSTYNSLQIGTPEMDNYLTTLETIAGVSRGDKISSLLE